MDYVSIKQFFCEEKKRGNWFRSVRLPRGLNGVREVCTNVCVCVCFLTRCTSGCTVLYAQLCLYFHLYHQSAAREATVSDQDLYSLSSTTRSKCEDMCIYICIYIFLFSILSLNLLQFCVILINNHLQCGVDDTGPLVQCTAVLCKDKWRHPGLSQEATPLPVSPCMFLETFIFEPLHILCGRAQAAGWQTVINRCRRHLDVRT